MHGAGSYQTRSSGTKSGDSSARLFVALPSRPHEVEPMNASVNPLGRSKPVSANKEVKQCVEAYLASEQAKQLRSPARDKREELLETFVRLSYEDKARAPQYLTGDELNDLLEESLPPYLDPKDSALSHLPALLGSFFDFLHADRKLSHPVEVRESLERAKEHLREWVEAIP